MWATTYFFAFAPETDGVSIVEAAGVAMAIVDDVAADDARLAVESVPAESRPADADVSIARLIFLAGRVHVTIVELVAARLFFGRFF